MPQAGRSMKSQAGPLSASPWQAGETEKPTVYKQLFTLPLQTAGCLAIDNPGVSQDRHNRNMLMRGSFALISKQGCQTVEWRGERAGAPTFPAHGLMMLFKRADMVPLPDTHRISSSSPKPALFCCLGSFIGCTSGWPFSRADPLNKRSS